MKRILYFTGYRMVAQEWSGRALKSSIYFEPDDTGMELFEAYLKSLKHEPVRMLVDLIEEEFRQITIPALRGSDRKTIIKRNHAKFFRNTKYNFAKTISISKKGRKEEQLLIAGLTNPDLIRPWLDIIEKTATPLSGILSLPVISEDLVATFKPDHQCVIVVSQQVPSNLRQSVFVNGRLILSRLVPIASFYDGDYASDVIRDIEGTRRYLVSQRIIDRNEILSVQVVCNKRHFGQLTEKCAENSDFDFHIQNINDLIENEKIEIESEQEFSSVLFCYRASKKLLVNHYAKGREKKYFHHYLTSLVARFSAVSLIAVSFGLFLIFILSAIHYQDITDEMTVLEQKYRAKFNRLNEQKVDASTSTLNMKNVIQAVDKLNNHYLHTPAPMLAMVSQDISLFPDMRVTHVDWYLASSMTADKADEQKKAAAPDRRSRNRSATRSGEKLFEIVRVDGHLLNFDGDYRYALSQIDDMEDSMRVSKKYTQVEITRRPLNIESDETISGDAGRTLSRDSQSAKVAEFSFRLAREIKLNEN